MYYVIPIKNKTVRKVKTNFKTMPITFLLNWPQENVNNLYAFFFSATDFQKQKPTTPEPLPPPPDLPADYLQMERETVAADYMNYSLPQQSTENQITNVKNQSDEENIDDFDDDPVDYINTEEFTEYMNIKQLPEYMNSGELPEYMNYDPMKNQVPNI